MHTPPPSCCPPAGHSADLDAKGGALRWVDHSGRRRCAAPPRRAVAGRVLQLPGAGLAVLGVDDGHHGGDPVQLGLRGARRGSAGQQAASGLYAALRWAPHPGPRPAPPAPRAQPPALPPPHPTDTRSQQPATHLHALRLQHLPRVVAHVRRDGQQADVVLRHHLRHARVVQVLGVVHLRDMGRVCTGWVGTDGWVHRSAPRAPRCSQPADGTPRRGCSGGGLRRSPSPAIPARRAPHQRDVALRQAQAQQLSQRGVVAGGEGGHHDVVVLVEVLEEALKLAARGWRDEAGGGRGGRQGGAAGVAAVLVGALGNTTLQLAAGGSTGLCWCLPTAQRPRRHPSHPTPSGPLRRRGRGDGGWLHPQGGPAHRKPFQK